MKKTKSSTSVSNLIKCLSWPNAPLRFNSVVGVFMLCVTASSLLGQTTELTNFQLNYDDASDTRVGTLTHNGGTFILQNESTNGVLSMSAENTIQMLNDDSEGRFYLHPNGNFKMGVSPTDFSGQYGKLGIFSDSDPDMPQLTLVETGNASDFARLRFLNDKNLLDGSGDLQNWTIAAKIGDPNDYRFIVALNGSSRMRFQESNGKWEFFAGAGLNARIVTDEIELNGSDFAEKFDIVSDNDVKVKPGFVVTIDPDKTGTLKVAEKAYDKKVVGIISGANGINPGMLMGQEGTIANGDYPVALSGRVYVATTDVNGNIQPGDMLTTSDVAGHAMKATKKKQSYGSIIGKAMTSPDENGFVLVLVNLQ